MTLDGPKLMVDHKSPSGPIATHVRGALIVSSLETLRELNLFARYEACLPVSQRDAVLYTIAASWVPCAVAMTHYAACDAMNVSPDELSALGARVASRIMGTYLGTLMRNVRPAGANVALRALPSYPKLWDRVLQGGACRVVLTGPKDATIESLGIPMFRFRYFRLGYLGMIRGAGLLLTKACYAREVSANDHAMTLAVSWV